MANLSIVEPFTENPEPPVGPPTPVLGGGGGLFVFVLVFVFELEFVLVFLAMTGSLRLRKDCD
ncbi:hypothetical protein [Saccharothrix violaceirubra]|uniref:Uncharacterized protein n=1 Tax=Saccharothrix violaceirubra TaxID=413306 RepID=A0A7W7SY34_9PSEU|nr:hypothetical protein [Saccharothrix violaceirubra]MBB4963051.1 hypothetical protein [Saccharothrix violaceirubra]